MSDLFLDADVRVPPHVPPHGIRSEHDVVIAIQMTLEQILAELRHINATLARIEEAAESTSGNERLSSIALEDLVKGPKATTKSYAGRPLTRELIDQHLDAHGYAHRRAEELALAGWAATIDALAELCP